jgi:hypothetical protein
MIDSNFSSDAGYSIEVWKAAVVRVGLKPVNYQFVCMEYDDLQKDLTDPSGICDVAAEDLAVGRAQISSSAREAYSHHFGPTFASLMQSSCVAPSLHSSAVIFWGEVRFCESLGTK